MAARGRQQHITDANVDTGCNKSQKDYLGVFFFLHDKLLFLRQMKAPKSKAPYNVGTERLKAK